MSMELHSGGFENRKVEQANQMQMQLADMHGEDIGDFINKRAEGFRNIVNEHPELLDEYQTAPEETLKKMGPLLYH